jgi:hypothetical protein
LATSSNKKSQPDSSDTLHDGDTPGGGAEEDTLTEGPPESGEETLQTNESSTLLSTPAPATALDRYLVDRLRGVEERLDSMAARVRLLEKKGTPAPAARQGLWLLVLPLIALMYWLSQQR